MPKKIFSSACCAFVATSIGGASIAQEVCEVREGVTALGFDIEPSLVVHSDAILDATFSSSGVDIGNGVENSDERVFSFNRTIGAILRSANLPDDQAARISFVRTMIGSFENGTGFALNEEAGVLMPLDSRNGEALQLTAEGLLNETSDIGLKPLAIFNRFDLAPADWAHCGEYRIVYGKVNPGFVSRFFLIFEASVPNPNPPAGEAGCRPITEFWAELSYVDEGDDLELVRRLSAFYYDGQTDLATPAPELTRAVVDYRNYGGDGGRGQVRGNLFMQQPWQLREWLTQPVFDPETPLAFVLETVKDNPLAELYLDDLAGTPISAANVPSALTMLHGDFVAALTSDIRENLMAEETKKYRALVDALVHYDLGSGPTLEVTEETVLKNAIALGNEERFNEHQSTSQGTDDSPPVLAGTTLRGLLDTLVTAPSPNLSTQSVDTFLARAQGGTCAGCHMTSPGTVIRENPGEDDTLWPDVHGSGFVHVAEDRTLSSALETEFLPFRRYVMGLHLCPVDVSTTAVAAMDPAEFEDVELVVARPPEAMSFVEEIVSDFVSEAAQVGPEALVEDEGTSLLMQASQQLDPVARDALRQRVRDEIAAARQLEFEIPGAFVEERRPH